MDKSKQKKIFDHYRIRKTPSAEIKENIVIQNKPKLFCVYHCCVSIILEDHRNAIPEDIYSTLINIYSTCIYKIPSKTNTINEVT